MNDASEPLIDLVEAARRERVVVVGGGIAGLIAALEFAKVGILVTLFEASDRLGGVMQSAEVDVGALTAFPAKDEAENAEAEVMAVATTAREIFMVR